MYELCLRPSFEAASGYDIQAARDLSEAVSCRAAEARCPSEAQDCNGRSFMASGIQV